MRVQPERPTAPFETIVTVSRGSAAATCSAHIRPAPPLPTIATSVSSTGSGASATGTDAPAAQAPDRGGRVDPFGARAAAAVDVVAAGDAALLRREPEPPVARAVARVR